MIHRGEETDLGTSRSLTRLPFVPRNTVGRGRTEPRVSAFRSLLFVICYVLLTFFFIISIIFAICVFYYLCCLLFGICYVFLLSDMCSVLIVLCCLLFGIWYLLFVICHVLFVIC